MRKDEREGDEEKRMGNERSISSRVGLEVKGSTLCSVHVNRANAVTGLV